MENEDIAIADGQEIDFVKEEIDLRKITLIRGREYKKEEQKILLLADELKELLAENKCWIAGGAVTSVFTNKPVNDLDIYFPSKEAFSNVMAEIFEDRDSYVGFRDAQICHITDKSILLRSSDQDVQFIIFRFFDNVEEIFESFDFTVNMGAYSFADRNFYLHENFMRHNAQRMLKFNSNTAYPLISMVRVDKYRERGYTTSKQEMLKIGFAINKKQFDTWEKVIDEVGSMYGLNKNEIFDTTKEFSMDEVLTQLDGLFIPKHYVQTNVEINFFKLEEMLPGKLADSVLEYVRLEKNRDNIWSRPSYKKYLELVAKGEYTRPTPSTTVKHCMVDEFEF